MLDSEFKKNSLLLLRFESHLSAKIICHLLSATFQDVKIK